MIHRMHYKYLNSYLSIYHVFMTKPLESTKMKGSKGGKQTRTKSQPADKKASKAELEAVKKLIQ
jgi:hypothetical protein